MILNSFTQNSLILVLTGVIISSFMNALISLILIISPSVLSKSMLYWLLGSFNLVETQFFFLAILAIFIVLIFNNYFSHGINLIGLGDEKSSSLGLNVKKFRLMVLLTTSLFVVLSILIAGIIGYIGLIIPHICRMMGIYNAKHLIPIAALFGAIFLIVSDDIARSILSPSELPIGIVTAIVGLPIFLFIILNLKKNVRN
jgi:iron complex transport system permease protein